jgi:thiol-disulfide isomerase/thioredoxin
VPESLSGLRFVEDSPQIPSVGFMTEDGSEVILDAFAGKTVVLNLWATWCSPCLREMPALDRLAGALPRDTHAVLAVSQDKGGTAVARPFMDRLGLSELQAHADPQGTLMRAFGIRGLPTTLIISPDGRLIALLEGVAEWNHPEAIRHLATISMKGRILTSSD